MHSPPPRRQQQRPLQHRTLGGHWIAAGLAVLAVTAGRPVAGLAVVCIVALAVVLVYAGVVLPAVWFSHPVRRRDARAVLQQLLDAIQQPGSPRP
jgi:Flp pilus assembly protein TadB